MPGGRLAAGIVFAAAACAAFGQETVRPNAPASVPAYTPPPFTGSTEPPFTEPPAAAYGDASPYFPEPVRDAAVTGASFSQLQPPPAAGAFESRTPIGRGGEAAQTDGGRPSAAATLRKGMWSSGSAVVVLAVVGGAVVRTLRKRNPQTAGALPREAVDLIGRQRLDAKNAVGLLRVGRRLLIVGIGEDGLRTLGEVTDAAEIDRLAGLCRPAGPGGGFAAMLQSAVPKAKPAAGPAPKKPAMADLPGLRGERPGRLDVTTP